jgi:precorrin-6B methylase 2
MPADIPPIARDIDYLARWRDEVISGERRHEAAGRGGGSDYWAEAAEDFDARAARHWSEDDGLREFALSLLRPGSSALDIGAGTGRWATFLAARAAIVTAIDSSPAMLRVMRDRISRAGARNIEIVEGTWPEIAVADADLCFCAHAIYAARDFEAFVGKMDDTAKEKCILIIRTERLATARGAMSQMKLAPRIVMGDESEGLRRSCLLYWPSSRARGDS